jgi:hypothetical protein
MSAPAEQWHLEKKVPLALIVSMIVGLLVQAATGIWFASRIEYAVTDVVGRVAKLEAARTADDKDTATLREHLARTLEGLARDVGYVRQRLEERPR